jgi:hypothetical protein
MGVLNEVGRDAVDKLNTRKSKQKIAEKHNEPKYPAHLELGPWASSHIMQSINPTHPFPNWNFVHNCSPSKAGRAEVRVERIRVRGIVNSVWPSCYLTLGWVYLETPNL